MTKQDKHDLFQKIDTITEKEIKQIDKRIKSCIAENPRHFSDEFYVKIWFNYKSNVLKGEFSGRQEFLSDTKENLIKDINKFLLSDKNGWCIIL